MRGRLKDRGLWVGSVGGGGVYVGAEGGGIETIRDARETIRVVGRP